MKKYGITKIEKDTTPGFKSKDITEEWYTTESERDAAYVKLTRPQAVTMDSLLSPDSMIEFSYHKMESE